MGEFLSHYFWLIIIAVSVVQHFQRTKSVENTVLLDPIKVQEMRTLGFLYSFGTILPWLILGIGILSGSTPNIWHLFRPQDGNPFVIAFFGVTLAISIATAWWVLFANGAKKVVEYRLVKFNVFGQVKPLRPWVVKLLATLGPFFVTFWIVLVARSDIPMPTFK